MNFDEALCCFTMTFNVWERDGCKLMEKQDISSYIYSFQAFMTVGKKNEIEKMH